MVYPIGLAGCEARQSFNMEVYFINTDLLINEAIRDPEVRLIREDGTQLGIMPTAQAQRFADEARLDLVKIAPNARPPVCKLMDYDKHRFEQAKREKEMRKNQKTVSLKEVQLSATIEENDIQYKARNAIRFLKAGDKVKVTIRFRGRQIAHSELGYKVMKEFAERLSDLATIERQPNLEGRHMIMILAPRQDKPSKPEKAEKKSAPTQETPTV
jgi:translation initiation factor IF-3